jgi:hypothetical protein
MSGTQIQAMFGQAVIDAVSNFAKNEIQTPEAIAATDFSHVSNQDLQKALSETLYGARWLYKIGLALLTSNLEQSAHIRTQVIDYASVCETLLADIILQAYSKGLMTGQQRNFFDLKKHKPLYWNTNNPLATINKTTFEWRIKVAEEEDIINAALATHLNSIRTHRNTVHLTQKVMSGSSYYVGLAKKSYTTLHELINQTKQWVASNP